VNRWSRIPLVWTACIILSGCGGLQTGDAPAPSTWTNAIGMTFAILPAGEYRMGSSPLDRFRTEDEMPRHRVVISHPFSLAVTEVTVGQYRRFIQETGYDMGDMAEWLQTADEQLPAAGISWEDARAFIQWLNDRDPGHRYRLPTEAEWEYACRAGTDTTWFFGDDFTIIHRYAWYYRNAGDGPRPVATRLPNPWGLYDMLGNVYEWVSDWYNAESYQQHREQDPTGPSSGQARVCRGGGWHCNPDNCRCAYRNYGPPDKRSMSIGFRIAADPTE